MAAGSATLSDDLCLRSLCLMPRSHYLSLRSNDLPLRTDYPRLRSNDLTLRSVDALVRSAAGCQVMGAEAQVRAAEADGIYLSLTCFNLSCASSLFERLFPVRVKHGNLTLGFSSRDSLVACLPLPRATGWAAK